VERSILNFFYFDMVIASFR